MLRSRDFSICRTAIPLILSFCFFLCACNRRPEAKPNLIIIVSDSLRKDVLGCYGGAASTPYIDRLADNGIIFERAYSTAPATMPSSTSLMTGIYSRSFITSTEIEAPENLIYYVNDSEKLLGEYVMDFGYDARFSVENDLALRANNMQGFDEFRHYTEFSASEIARVERICGIRIIGSDPDQHRSSKYEEMYGMLHYLLTVPQEQNFLLLKWFFDPHAPYNPPDKFRKAIAFDTSTLPREPDFYTNLRHFSDAKAFTQEECAYLKELYLAEVESVDERVSFILKALEHSNLLNNTIIVFTSDHGEFFGEHDRLHHGRSYFEQLVNVPLIFTGPRIPREGALQYPVSLVDLVSTLKDLLISESQEDMAGQSFSIMPSRRHSALPRPIYMDRIANRFLDQYIDYDALLRNRYKLITYLQDEKAVYQLYDLANDPEEMNDMAGKFPEIVRELHESILQFRQECDLRLDENLGKINPKNEVNQAAKKIREQLKTLGYIR